MEVAIPIVTMIAAATTLSLLSPSTAESEKPTSSPPTIITPNQPAHLTPQTHLPHTLQPTKYLPIQPFEDIISAEAPLINLI